MTDAASWRDQPKPDWWREEIHGSAGLDTRQSMREVHDINAPLRGPRGLDAIARQMLRKGAAPAKPGPYIPGPPPSDEAEREAYFATKQAEMSDSKPSKKRQLFEKWLRLFARLNPAKSAYWRTHE